MKRRNNKLEYCYRSLTVLTRSTLKYTTKPVDEKLDTLAIEFEATAFKAAFCSLFFEVPSQPCQHWKTHYIPLSPPLRISFSAWADRRANNTYALPDVRDLRTSGNCCYQSPPFRRPRDQKKRRLWGREWRKFDLIFTHAQTLFSPVGISNIHLNEWGRGFDSHRGQKNFFFTSCGSLIPLTRANAQ